MSELVPSTYRVELDRFRRWIIVTGDGSLAWSGSRWVPMGGFVQICNFSTAPEAHRHAQNSGMLLEEIKVDLKPRTFTEVAEHFTKVTKSVDWPTDEPDID